VLPARRDGHVVVVAVVVLALVLALAGSGVPSAVEEEPALGYDERTSKRKQLKWTAPRAQTRRSGCQQCIVRMVPAHAVAATEPLPQTPPRGDTMAELSLMRGGSARRLLGVRDGATAWLCGARKAVTDKATPCADEHRRRCFRLPLPAAATAVRAWGELPALDPPELGRRHPSVAHYRKWHHSRACLAALSELCLYPRAHSVYLSSSLPP
jgi:hypothetical protein